MIISLMKRCITSSFFKDNLAATAIEFALLLPIYLFMLFGAIEIGLVLLFSMLLSFGSNDGVKYLRHSAADGLTVTEQGLRNAVTERFFSDAIGKAHVALYAVSDADLARVNVSLPVEDRFDQISSLNSQYILAVGYDWPFIMPSTSVFFGSVYGRYQLTNITLAILPVRVKE